jgi:diguanylate cyclase (GGDEF)-like protein
MILPIAIQFGARRHRHAVRLARVSSYQQDYLRYYIAPIVPKVMLCVAAIFLASLLCYWSGLLASNAGALAIVAITGGLCALLALITHHVASQGRVNATGYAGVAFLMVVCGSGAIETAVNDQDVLHALPYSVLASVAASFFWLRRHHFVLGQLASFVPALLLMLTGTYERQAWSFVLQVMVIAVIASTAIHVLTTRTNRRMYELSAELMERATYDGLTGVLNRTTWLEQARILLQEAQRQRVPTSCLYIDLDGFKQINDHHGHGVGDGILEEVAETLIGFASNDRLVGRIGGDEFVLLLPAIGVGEAETIAEAIRQALGSLEHPVGSQEASIGVATSVDGEAIEHLVVRADFAMMDVKLRNQRGHARGQTRP